MGCKGSKAVSKPEEQQPAGTTLLQDPATRPDEKVADSTALATEVPASEVSPAAAKVSKTPEAEEPVTAVVAEMSKDEEPIPSVCETPKLEELLIHPKFVADTPKAEEPVAVMGETPKGEEPVAAVAEVPKVEEAVVRREHNACCC